MYEEQMKRQFAAQAQKAAGQDLNVVQGAVLGGGRSMPPVAQELNRLRERAAVIEKMLSDLTMRLEPVIEQRPEAAVGGCEPEEAPRGQLASNMRDVSHSLRNSAENLQRLLNDLTV